MNTKRQGVAILRVHSQLIMLIGIFLSLLALILTTGCAKKKNDISTVSTDAYLDKSDITGCDPGKESVKCSKTFSAVKTFMNANEELDNSGIIPGFHADLGYVQFSITEKELQVKRVGEINRTPDKNTLVAAFPITAHFDIIRERNDFGEETNKTVEDTKKPWDQRKYIRVDWGTNLVKSTSIANIFSTSIEEEGAQVVSPLKKNGSLLSFDVDASVTKKEFDPMDENEELMIGSFRAHIKNSFLEVKQTDYRPYEMSNSDFARFGYFRSYEDFINPGKGKTVSGRKFFANRFNVCEKSVKTSGLSCTTNRIVYTLNEGFPEEFKAAARDVVAAWNKSFQKALDRTDQIVILDESVQPQIGDTRYNMIAAIEENVPTGLLGVSQTVNNPNSGETLAARASVYLGTVKVDAGDAGEKFDILLGGGGGAVIGKGTGVDAGVGASMGSNSSANALSIAVSTLNLSNISSSQVVKNLKLRNQLLKMKNYKLFSPIYSKINSNSVKSIMDPYVHKESAGHAIFRRQQAFSLFTPRYDVDDNAWKPNSHIQDLKIEDALTFGKASQKSRIKMLNQEAEGIHNSDFIEPAIELYIKKFIIQHVGEPKDQLRAKLEAEVRYLVFYTTLIHEMGHNFGLRHNFAGSSDKKNYTAKYNELEARRQDLIKHDPTNPKIAEIALEEQSYDFSSVMDYTGSFYETRGGTGPYDDAAIRYGYNTSIDRDGDPIAGIVRGYRFCTDHEVGEDLLCQRWDKGTNNAMTLNNLIANYHRNYVFRNFRRDRAEFGDVGVYFRNILIRKMLPIRQVADEFLYQLITSKTVAAGQNQCDLKWLKDSVDTNEVANLCDPAVAGKYAQFGIDFSDWSQLVYLLLNDDFSGFRKRQNEYLPNGFADLLWANYLASNFFQEVIGTPQPGLYLPVSGAGGVAELAVLPNVDGDDEAKVKAFLLSQGLTDADAAAQAAKLKAKIVDLKPGPQAKYLTSQLTQDGSFKRIETMGFVFDKLAAIIIMGARGLPIEKYQEISLNLNTFFAPQMKMLTTGLMNSLVNENTKISMQTVVNRSGEEVDAVLPAALDLNTKAYGVLTAASDFISDQNREMASKLRVCSADDVCPDFPGNTTPAVGFRGPDAGSTFKALQVASGDSIAFTMIEKGDSISKERDQAMSDIGNVNDLVGALNKILAGGAAKNRAEALNNLLAQKAPALGEKLAGAIGTGSDSIWTLIMSQGQDLKNDNPSVLLNIRSQLGGFLESIDATVKSDLEKQPEVLAQVQVLLVPVENDMLNVNSYSVRIVASPTIRDNDTAALRPIEADAYFVRSVMKSMGNQ